MDPRRDAGAVVPPDLQPLTLRDAVHHLTRNVPTASPEETAAEVLQRLAGHEFDSASEIVVLRDRRLDAIVSIEELFAAEPHRRMRELGDHDPPVVGPATPGEEAAWKAVRHHEGSLAVVDAEGEFLGMIPPDRLLAVLLWEHDEDAARFGGLLRGTTAARAASEAPVGQRFWHRIPWLGVGLAGSLLSVDIVRSFESELEREVSLAFFLPAVVYLADAVGTQTEALAIRGLPLGVSIRRIFFSELLTGTLVGLVLAAIFFPIAIWRWGGTDVAGAVAVALFAACAIASIVALLLPWGFQKLGLDPAFGSGPLATVAQDLLSIVVYFAVAVAVVN